MKKNTNIKTPKQTSQIINWGGGKEEKGGDLHCESCQGSHQEVTDHVDDFLTNANSINNA
jgi:hypothetical protein